MTLLIVNLPIFVTEDLLRKWYSERGVSISAVRLYRTRLKGSLRCFGLFDVDAAHVELALRLSDKKEMFERVVRVRATKGARIQYAILANH